MITNFKPKMNLPIHLVIFIAAATLIFSFGIVGAAFSQIVLPTNDMVLNNRDLVIKDSAGRTRLRLDAQSGDIRVFDENGQTTILEAGGANLKLGGNNSKPDGDIVIFKRNTAGTGLNDASGHWNGDNGALSLGGGGTNGQLVTKDKDGKQTMFLDGRLADVTLGQQGQDGDLIVRNKEGQSTITIDGETGNVNGRGQILSTHNASGEGLDAASVYLESKNPSLAFRDSTNQNTDGWYIQASSKGSLHFAPGDLTTIAKSVVILEKNGDICIGKCD